MNDYCGTCDRLLKLCTLYVFIWANFRLVSHQLLHFEIYNSNCTAVICRDQTVKAGTKKFKVQEKVLELFNILIKFCTSIMCFRHLLRS